MAALSSNKHQKAQLPAEAHEWAPDTNHITLLKHEQLPKCKKYN